MPLNSNPQASIQPGNFIGHHIVLDASNSTGDIAYYGWQLDDSSPTTAAVAYAQSSSHKGSDFVPITAVVRKEGIYIFGLTVYDAAGNKDFATVSIEIKSTDKNEEPR